MDADLLHQKGTCIFKGQYTDAKNTKVQVVALPTSFQELGKEKELLDVYKEVGIDEYFKLPPCGIDVQRAHELMTTIEEDGVAELTNKDGEKVKVPIMNISSGTLYTSRKATRTSLVISRRVKERRFSCTSQANISHLTRWSVRRQELLCSTLHNTLT